MSNKKLDALKALFKKEKESKTDNGGKKRGDMYPFWQMDLNKKAVIRILPDKNQDNPYMFYVDKLEHTLSINGKNERVPCLQMYGEKCPICDVSRDYYKAEGKASANGKYYYRKKISLLRVLVVEDPLPPDEETGEKSDGKVLNTQFGYQLMEKIKEEIGSDELGDALPWDMEEGYNFNIKKTPQGEYGTYTVGSGFARRPTAIDADLLETIELVDLETLLPKNPGYEFVKRKLDAHISGDDAEETGDEEEAPEEAPVKQTRKPAPRVEKDGDEGDDAPPPAKQTSKPSKAEQEADTDAEGEDDILAQIRRNRQKKS